MIKDRFDLSGRVAAVTGSNRGIGEAVAIGLAEAGADIALISRGDAEQVAERIRGIGRRVHVINSDLGRAETAELDAVVDSVVGGLGGIDILVNNAGTIRRAPAVDYTDQDWSDVLSVNLDAVFGLSRAAGRIMLDQGRGRIINVASMLSFQGGILVPAYTASKHAVAGLTKALANEWAASGVTVNAVAPGYIATDNTQALRDDPERSESILSRIPAGRWGSAEDLQGAFVFLASDAAAYVTGTVVPVDGGWLVR